MSDKSYKDLAYDGFWKNNPALVQLLGLCPLLAVSGSVVNALGLGLATMLVLTGSNIAVSLVRNFVPDTIRLPTFVMIIASFTSCIELLMKAYTFELYQILGIFIPLIITNCTILGRADAFASRNPILPAAWDGLVMGAGFAAVLLALGLVRELVGAGTLFANMDLLLGPMAANWTIQPFANYSGFLVLVLPPGAFIITGLLIAWKNTIDAKIKARELAQKANQPKQSRRVRVTGKIT